jgi:hypothetical protein
LSGIRATIGEDGIVEMTIEDAKCLISPGWTVLDESNGDKAA